MRHQKIKLKEVQNYQIIFLLFQTCQFHLRNLGSLPHQTVLIYQLSLSNLNMFRRVTLLQSQLKIKIFELHFSCSFHSKYHFIMILLQLQVQHSINKVLKNKLDINLVLNLVVLLRNHKASHLSLSHSTNKVEILFNVLKLNLIFLE